MSITPFDLKNTIIYQRWRDSKLKNYPNKPQDLIVEINDPRHLTVTEHKAMLQCCRHSNMVIYASKIGDDPARNIPHAIGQQFGLHRLNHNWLGGKDGLTSLTIATKGTKKKYIPYSNRALQWHTDGYYNSPDKKISAVLLHCVQSAIEGGANDLIDNEIVYLLLREKNPAYIQALMAKDVLTIPAREKNGKIVRAAETDAVFSIDKNTGNLHTRYTIRKHNVIWKNDELTQQARRFFKKILTDSPFIFHHVKLEAGMGLLSNNVLHNRTAFNDTKKQRRLLYRARYFDRIANTNILSI